MPFVCGIHPRAATATCHTATATCHTATATAACHSGCHSTGLLHTPSLVMSAGVVTLPEADAPSPPPTPPVSSHCPTAILCCLAWKTKSSVHVPLPPSCNCTAARSCASSRPSSRSCAGGWCKAGRQATWHPSAAACAGRSAAARATRTLPRPATTGTSSSPCPRWGACGLSRGMQAARAAQRPGWRPRLLPGSRPQESQHARAACVHAPAAREQHSVLAVGRACCLALGPQGHSTRVLHVCVHLPPASSTVSWLSPALAAWPSARMLHARAAAGTHGTMRRGLR